MIKMKQKFTWQTLNRLRVFCLTLLVSMMSIGAYAQCTNSSVYGSATAPGTIGGSATFSTCSWYGEYSPLSSVQAASVYSCNIGAGGYITIHEGSYNGPVVGFGLSPLTWNSTTAGTYYCHWNTDAACGTLSTCITTTVTYLGASSACSGTPTGGTATANGLSGTAGACLNQALNLGVTGATSASGLTYQWEYSTSGLGGSYASISGATNSTYTINPYLAANAGFYDLVVSCGSNSATSIPVEVTTNGFLSCYCASGLGGSCPQQSIQSVVIASTALNNVTSGCSSPYSSFPASGSTTASFIAGTSYNFTVGTGMNGNPGQIAVWIDFDHSGTFDASEFTLISASSPSGGTSSLNINIPITATGGLTGMRIRSDWEFETLFTGIDACDFRAYGETEDYTVDIIIPAACSGTPNPGNTLASATSVCPNTSVTFSLQNVATLGSGVTFQWYNNGGAISGATSSFYVTNISAADDYYCDVTCLAGGGTPVTASSNLVSIAINGYLSCYCMPNHLYGTSGNYWGAVSNVTFDAINNSSTSPAGTPSYTDYPPGAGTTAVVYTGTNIPLSVTVNNGPAAAWFDWDQSGTFDVSEFFYLGSTSSGTPTTFTALVPVPGTALAGQIKMRIRSEAYFYAPILATQACGNLYYGETEDYTLTVLIPSPCSGAPAPGNTLASATSVCANTMVNFSLQFPTIGTGVSYQWYNNGGAIAGATNSYYSQAVSFADDFYCDVTCDNLGTPITTSSNLVSIAMNPFYACYCVSSATQAFDEEILNVTVGSMNNTSGCGFTGGPGSTSSLYSDYTTIVSAPIISLGTTVPFSVQVGTCGGNFTSSASIWIDFDHSGTFDSPAERVFNTLAPNVSGPYFATGSFIVPVTALTGVTRMRVINTEGGGTPMASACGTYGYGETEDYLVDIAPLPMDPPNPMQANTPNCATGGDLAAVGTAPPGETWYWQTAATGTSTAFPASSNYNILANGTYYIRSQSNAYLTWSAGAGSITVTNFPVGPVDPTTSAPAGNPACGSVTLVSSVATAGSTNFWQGTNPTGTSSVLIADDGTTNTPINLATNGTYYLRARDNTSFCWSNNVATTVTVLTIPTAPLLSAAPSSICPGGNSALSAVAPSAPPTGYSVATIPYAPVSPITTSLANAGPTGDEGTTLAPLGFSFNYFGTPYSNVTVHTNGYIVFGTYGFGSYTPTPIPTVANTNGWAGYWSDLNASAGQITYATQGTAPNRMFIANYNAVNYYSSSPHYSGQIVVYEATGAIDVYLSNTSATYYPGACGVENQTGTAGTAAPSMNAVYFGVTNTAFRFSPIQAIGFLWTPNGPGSGIAAGNETLANTSASPSATTTYTMTLTDPLNGCTSSGTVMVDVLPIPAAPSATGGATPCGIGSATLNAIGASGTLNWYDVPVGGSIVGTGGTFNTPPIGANTMYYVEETNGTCSSTRTSVLATFTPSDAIAASSNVGYVCSNGANASADLTAASMNGNYSYTWNPGGLSGTTVTVTPGSTTTYTVTGVDGLCTNTATVTVNVGLVPTINSTTATPAILCVSGTSQLVVDAGQFAPSGYCTPTVGFTGATGDFINSFSFNTLSNLSSGDGPDYAMYPQTTSVQLGSTYPITVTPGSAWPQGKGVWIDYNRNGSFADAGEFVFSGASSTAASSGTVTIPITATLGQTRVRVAVKYNGSVLSTESCGHTGFGEFEDYVITLGAGSSLNFAWSPATGLSNTNTYNPSATVSSTSTYNVDVSDAFGCSTSSSVTVTVNQPSSSTDNVTHCGAYVWAADGMTYTATGTYTATSLNAGGCVHTSTLNLTIACNTTINLVCFIEGYWDGVSQMQPVLFNQGEPTTTGACDSIDVELRDPLTPLIVDASVRTVLNQNGTATCLFPPMTGNKYIVVKHRSAVQTWSANAEPMGTTVNYNFSTAASQAYGSNQVQIGTTGIYAFYSGDIIVDENVDLLDLGNLETEISNFGSGYMPADINGDGNVDLLDSPILETNVNNFIFSNHP